MPFFERADFDDPYGRAVDDTKDAFVRQGFSLLSQVDVRASLSRETETGVAPMALLGFYVPDLVEEAGEAEPVAALVFAFHVLVHARHGRAAAEVMHPALGQTAEGLERFQPNLEAVVQRVRTALRELATVGPA